jgi:hypothetical protein
MALGLMMRIVSAILAAVLIQPLFGITYTFLPMLGVGESLPVDQILQYSIYVLVFASFFVVVLGVPLFFLLKHFGKATKANVSGLGLVLSILPVLVIGWPRHMEGYSSGGNWHGTHVEFYLNGVPTTYAWLSYAESIFWYGAHGLFGALLFYIIYTHDSPQAVPADHSKTGAG